MKLYFYNRKRYPAKEEPQYYNVSQGYGGYAEQQANEVCLFEGTIEEFEAHIDSSTPNNQQRRRHRTNRLPLN